MLDVQNAGDLSFKEYAKYSVREDVSANRWSKALIRPAASPCGHVDGRCVYWVCNGLKKN